MKKKLLIYILLVSAVGCAQKKEKTHTEQIEEFQYEMNVEYSDKKTSPLKEEDLKDFRSLEFFPIDISYRIVADFERTPDEPIFEMQTSTDRKPLYTQYGIATFTIDGKKLSLRVYQNQQLMLDPEYVDYLFIPFNDITNGAETYDAGRYLDIRFDAIKENEISIDFNKAYNPYCAYNDKYSCPIPPRENDLDVEIKAGVLNFGKH